MLWLVLAIWPFVALLIGCLLGRSVAMEDAYAARCAPELAHGDPEPAGAESDTGYALAEQG